MNESIGQTMIRSGWRERLQFASQATISELIDPQAKVTSTLKGELGQISPEDVEMLANIGLPRIEGCLYPTIDPVTTKRDTDLVFLLGGYDDGLNMFTGQPDPQGPQHLFVAETFNGGVAKVSRDLGGYRIAVNATVRQFAEMAWRFYHIEPVLFEMQHSGDNIPFAYEEEHVAVKQSAWATALQVDPSIDSESPDAFWWGNIMCYL